MNFLRKIISFTFTIALLWVQLALSWGCVSSGEHQEALSAFEQLKNENDKLKQKLQSAENSKATTDNQLNEIKNRYAKLEEKNKSISRQVIDLNSQVEKSAQATESKLTEANRSLQECQSSARANAENLKRLQQERAALLKAKTDEVARLKNTYEKLVTEMKNEIKKGEITITALKDKLTFTIVDHVLFSSGSVNIKKSGREVLTRAYDIIKGLQDKNIQVSGHTDNVPIGSQLRKLYKDNWDLSVSRATHVARYLQSRGINPERLSASGYSKYRPMASNDTREGRAQNRRIEIVLTPIVKPKEMEAVTSGMSGYRWSDYSLNTVCKINY